MFCHAVLWERTFLGTLRNPKKGPFAKGRCVNLSQIARQICAKLPVFHFVHQRKGAQNCRKFVANLKVNFGQVYANTPFTMPPSPNFRNSEQRALNTDWLEIEADKERQLTQQWPSTCPGWQDGRAIKEMWTQWDKLVGALRGNTIRGNTTLNSERKMALWEGLWEGLGKTSENLSKPLKASENLWKPSLSEVLSETLPEAEFPLRTSQACCP